MKTLSLLCLGILDLSLLLRGMVCSSVVKLQMSVAVQASAQPLYYRGATSLLQRSNTIYSSQNYGFCSFSKNLSFKTIEK